MLYAATSPPRFVTLVLLTGLSTLSLNMFLPSLPNIAADLRADYALVSLSIAGYLGTTAVLQLIMGPLSDRYGRRPVLLTGVATFALASLACALARDIWIFLAFRILQGAIISGYILSLATIRDTVPRQKAASLIGYLTMAMAIAPMLGPMAGGVLDESFGWRASFLVYTGLGLAAFALCWVDLGETATSRSQTLRQHLNTFPELFRSRRFWGYALCMAFSTAAYYAFLTGAPLVTEALFGMAPARLGFFMGIITAGFMFGGFLSGRYAQRFSLTTMMIAGRIVACAGMLAGLGLYLADLIEPVSFFGATIFVGIGNGMTMPSSNAGALSVRPHLAGSAAGLAGALTVGCGGMLAAATGAIVTEANGAYALFGIMLFASVAGLVAALHVRRIDIREGTGS